MNPSLPNYKNIIVACAALFLGGAALASHLRWFQQTSASNDPGPGFSQSIIQVVPMGVAAGQPKSEEQENAEQIAYENELREAMRRTDDRMKFSAVGTKRH